MAAKTKISMVYLGTKEKEYTKDGVDKKSVNVKLMDFESDIYDFYVKHDNHNLLNILGQVPPMSQVVAVIEVGAYQTKPTIRLVTLEIPAKK